MFALGRLFHIFKNWQTFSDINVAAYSRLSGFTLTSNDLKPEPLSGSSVSVRARVYPFAVDVTMPAIVLGERPYTEESRPLVFRAQSQIWFHPPVRDPKTRGFMPTKGREDTSGI